MNSIYATPRQTLPLHQNQAVSCEEENSLMNANVSLHGYKYQKSGKKSGTKKSKSCATSTPTPQQPPKQKKKHVRFLSAPPSPQVYSYEAGPADLYWTEDAYDAMIQDMRTTLELYASNPLLFVDEEDDDTSLNTTMRGLERRTPAGNAERMQWRADHRNAVLDEQDRQWALLPEDEPTDDLLLSLASLTHSRDAAALALEMGREYAAQEAPVEQLELEEEAPLVFSCRPSESEDSAEDDEEEEEDATVLMNDSFNTLRSFYSSNSSLASNSTSTGGSSNSSFPACPFQASRQQRLLCSSLVMEQEDEDDSNRTEDDEEDQAFVVRPRPHGTPNTKGHSVSFPLNQLQQDIPAPPNPLSLEDVKELWNPSVRLEDVQRHHAAELAVLEGIYRDERVDPATLRGLEAYTATALAETRQTRATLWFAMAQKQQDPHTTSATLARVSHKLTSQCRKIARSRGLRDQRAVQSYCYGVTDDARQRQKSNTSSSSKKKTKDSSKRRSSNASSGGSTKSSSSTARSTKSSSSTARSTKGSGSRGRSSSSSTTAARLPPALAWTSDTPVTTSRSSSNLPPKMPVRTTSHRSSGRQRGTSTSSSTGSSGRNKTAVARPIER